MTVSGVTAQPTNMTLCVGDNVTYTCTVNSIAHAWHIGPLPEMSVTSGTSEDTIGTMGFIYRLVEIGSNGIVSSATGTVFPGLNNSVILCRNGLFQPRPGSVEQEAILKIYGKFISLSV